MERNGNIAGGYHSPSMAFGTCLLHLQVSLLGCCTHWQFFLPKLKKKKSVLTYCNVFGDGCFLGQSLRKKKIKGKQLRYTPKRINKILVLCVCLCTHTHIYIFHFSLWACNSNQIQQDIIYTLKLEQQKEYIAELFFWLILEMFQLSPCGQCDCVPMGTSSLKARGFYSKNT